MATTIVERADPEDIPEAPINILRDVVNLRKKSARFFNRLADESKDETIKVKNATHDHIINVLDRVLGKFEGMISHVRGKEAKPSGTVDVADLNNMFAHLEVQDAEGGADGEDEQSSDADDRASGASRKTKKNKNGVKKKKGRKDQRSSRSNGQASSSNGASPSQSAAGHSWVEDIQFATGDLDMDDPFDYYMLVYCFFEDFNIIRNYIQERWCDYYYDNSVSLNTLAVVTNAACEFFKHMELDLRSILGVRRRQMADYKAMSDMLFFDYGIDHIDYDSYDDLDDEETNERIFSAEADWLALGTYWDMKQCLDNIPPGKVPTMPPSYMEQPSEFYGSTRLHDRRGLVHRLVMEYMQEAATVKALKKNRFEPLILPAETQVLLGFELALERKYLTSHAVFSMQLYVDIRTILEHKAGDAFATMQKTAQWVDRTLETHKAAATGPRASLLEDMNGWQRDNRHYMLEDSTLVDMKHRFEKMHIDEPVPEFVLQKCDPIWTGLLDFRAKLTTNDLGDKFASRVPLIEAAAYIFSAVEAACRQEQHQSPAVAADGEVPGHV